MDAKLRELEARLIQAREASECLAILIAMAELHAERKRNREGLRCAREALNIARAREDRPAAARALAAAARCHYQRGDFVSAVAAGVDALGTIGEDEAAARSRANCQVARALYAVESCELAERHARSAADEAARAGDVPAEAEARTVLGIILARRGAVAEARAELRRAGGLQRRLGDLRSLKKTATCIGHGYRDQANAAVVAGAAARARLLWRQAIRVYRTAVGAGASHAEDAIALAALAECECRLEAHDAALATLAEAIELATRSGNPRAMAICHLRESQALHALGRNESARRACERARDAAEQLEHDPILAEILRVEATLNGLAGQADSAHVLEERAGRVSAERAAFLARVRGDIALLFGPRRGLAAVRAAA